MRAGCREKLLEQRFFRVGSQTEEGASTVDGAGVSLNKGRRSSAGNNDGIQINEERMNVVRMIRL